MAEKRGRSSSEGGTDSPSQSAKKGKGQTVSSVSIQHVDIEEDFVSIINRSSEPQDISGWSLQSKVQNQLFTFPPNTTLLPGMSVIVWSGERNQWRGNPPGSFFWSQKENNHSVNRYIWNNKGDTAILKNASGEVLDEKEEKPPSVPLRNVVILQLDLKGDFVTVINKEPGEVDISGWFIKSTVGGNQNFLFPKGTVLKAGQSTTVWSGKGADARNNPPHAFFWTNKHMWNDNGDGAALYNAQGELLSTSNVFPIKERETPPNPKK
jgi:hypothetical protein